jgi:hypothetical protein
MEPSLGNKSTCIKNSPTAVGLIEEPFDYMLYAQQNAAWASLNVRWYVLFPTSRVFSYYHLKKPPTRTPTVNRHPRLLPEPGVQLILPTNTISCFFLVLNVWHLD